MNSLYIPAFHSIYFLVVITVLNMALFHWLEHVSNKYSKCLKYAKGKYAKVTKNANTFLIAKYAKHSRSTQSVFMNRYL